MQGIVTALLPEARPFIDTLGLKRDLSIKNHQLYTNDEYALIVTGMGSIPAAIGTTVLLQHFGSKLEVLGTIGVAAGPKEYAIGNCYAIHKVTHQSTGKTYYPEMIVKSSLTEVALITVDEPVEAKDTEVAPESLVDMECAGILKAAQYSLTFEQMLAWKVISDHFEPGTLSKEKIKDYISKHHKMFLESLNELHKLILQQSASPLNDSDIEFIEYVSETLRFTHSQKVHLHKAALRHSIKSEQSDALKAAVKSSELLMTALQEPPSHKQERGQLFQEIIDVITPS